MRFIKLFIVHEMLARLPRHADDRCRILRAELDAWYAHLYGLSRDELRYILDPADVYGPAYPSETFRVLKNNDIREFGDYRTQRMVLHYYDHILSFRDRGQPYVPEYEPRPVELEASDDSLSVN